MKVCSFPGSQSTPNSVDEDTICGSDDTSALLDVPQDALWTCTRCGQIWWGFGTQVCADCSVTIAGKVCIVQLKFD
jgi:ribosomal protein L37E